MGRRPTLVVAVAAGVVLTAALVAVAVGGGRSDRAAPPAGTSTPTTTVATTLPATTTTAAPFTPVPPFTAIVSAWSPGGLDPGFVAALPSMPGVVASTVVQGGRVMLASSADPAGAPVDTYAGGFAVPLDALAVNPGTYPPFVATEFQPALAGLGPGQAVLGETSAALRRLGPGGTLTLLDGTTIEIVAVLPDVAVAGAEVVVAVGTVRGTETDRFVLVAHDGDVQGVAGRLRDAFPAARPLRVREPGEVPYLRHGDGVLTEAEVKSRFGEFSFVEGATRDFGASDAAWVGANIGSAPVAVIGRAECHTAILPDLAAALDEVDAMQQAMLAELAASTTTTEPTTPPPEAAPPPEPPLLAADANLGCFNPRLIRPGEGVSRHAYGIAIDLAPPSSTGEHHPRLIDIFEAHGFRWGGDFLASDPIHFEWVGDI